jgi:hypothetical protein
MTWVLTGCAKSSGKWGKCQTNQSEAFVGPEHLVDEGGAADEVVNSCPAVGCFVSGAQPWLLATWHHHVTKGGDIEKTKAIGDQDEEKKWGPCGVQKRDLACGSALKDLDAAAPSESERDWLEEKLEVTGATNEHEHMLNGTKWDNLCYEKRRELTGRHAMEGQKTVKHLEVLYDHF